LKKVIKKIIKWIINISIRLVAKTTLGSYVYTQVIGSAMNRTQIIEHQQVNLKFSIPNILNRYRVETFASKEPETLKWIDSIPEKSVLWDVGANIGLYTIYAAKARNCCVISFEPSVFNLELLARNVFANSVQRQVTIIPIALSDNVGSSMLKMTSTEWGGALSTFGESFDQNGNALKEVFEYKTIAFSLSDAVRLLGIPMPKYIKIDVDGIEHFILRGGACVLSEVDSVLVEINDDFTAQADEAAQHLKNAGLYLYRKCDPGGNNQFNQWWIRGSLTSDRS
jgi:FkbM family methyltransferase